jgi:hypothetical protein
MTLLNEPAISAAVLRDDELVDLALSVALQGESHSTTPPSSRGAKSIAGRRVDWKPALRTAYDDWPLGIQMPSMGDETDVAALALSADFNVEAECLEVAFGDLRSHLE